MLGLILYLPLSPPPHPRIIPFLRKEKKKCFLWSSIVSVRIVPRIIDLTLCFHKLPTRGHFTSGYLMGAVRVAPGYRRPGAGPTGYCLLECGDTVRGLLLFLSSRRTWKRIIFAQYPVIIAHSCRWLAWGLWLPWSCPGKSIVFHWVESFVQQK